MDKREKENRKIEIDTWNMLVNVIALDYNSLILLTQSLTTFQKIWYFFYDCNKNWKA